MTTFSALRFTFGLAITLGLTALHLYHEEHREHLLAHEILVGLGVADSHGDDHNGGHHGLGDTHNSRAHVATVTLDAPGAPTIAMPAGGDNAGHYGL